MQFLETEGSLHLVGCAARGGTGACVMRRGRATEPRVYIDEAPIIGGIDVLATFLPCELYLVEVYSAGLEIRAYTHWYMERMAGRPGMLFPIGL